MKTIMKLSTSCSIACIIIASLSLILVGCQTNNNIANSINNNITQSNVTQRGETVNFTKQLEAPIMVTLRTSDNYVIKGAYYPNKDSNKGVILLHQFNKNKNSWAELIPSLQKTHNVLAIDLRGHGQSSGNLSAFTENDFNNMQLDVKAAEGYLKRQGIPTNAISYIGASIGANTAQNFASDNSYDKVILLSPGINYKGIKLTMKDNEALIVVSQEDTYSYNSVKQLQETSPKSEFIILQNKGHGTNMLDKELIQKISNFLNN